MKALWNDHIIAQTSETVVVEGNHYFPPDSAKRQYLSNSDTTTFCPWKGTANYFHIKVEYDTNEDAAWYYTDPKAETDAIKNHIAFWKGVRIESSSIACTS